MRIAALLPLALLVGAGLVACGSDDTDPASGADGTVLDDPADTTAGGSTPAGSGLDVEGLDGRTFESTGADGYDLVEGSTVTLRFLDGSLSANGGCNTLAGAYSVDGDTLVAGNLASTMMACDEALMNQDTWLSGLLTSSPTVVVDGLTMTITGGDSTLTLIEVEPASIEGTTWNLTGTVATEAISSLPADAVASLTITDGQAAVATGCNNGSGAVEVGDGTLTFGPLATTRKMCPDELMALETFTLQVLDGEVTYTIDGDRLSIRKAAADGEIGLEYTAA
jgi:heat shock protein HslJ